MSQPQPHLSTSHACFLRPSDVPGQPPVSILLRGVNLSSTSKFPTLPESLSSYADLRNSTRAERDQKRRALAGQESHLGEDAVRFFSEAEQGGREGWFVGHPFPEEEADVHLRRLKAWGFTTIRYLVTWEALEHAGPGKYDEAFIDYTIRILRKCKEHGFRVFISPHQDVFSRFISGSGAPYWALVAVGLNPRRINQTGSGVVHQCWAKEGFGGDEGLKQVADDELEDWPDMIWNTNLNRLAARHCFTMFFASDDFAPKCTIDGVSAKQYLQDHYIEAYGHLADKLRDAGNILDECLVGWDSMNEPHEGFVGIPDLSTSPESQNFKKGPSPTPIQGFLLGNGQKVTDIELNDFTSTGQKSKGTITLTPPGAKAVWLTKAEAKDAERRWGWKWGQEWDFWDERGEGGCPWAGHGVWNRNTGDLLEPEYFHKPGEKEADFIQGFWREHYETYIKRIRRSHPNAISFVNPPVFESPPDLSEDVKEGRLALSSHFYDGLTLLGKRRHIYNADAVGLQRGLTNLFSAIKFGPSSIRSTLRNQLGELKSDAHNIESVAADRDGGDYPTIIGEIGTPWDMKSSTKLLGLAKGKANRKDYKEPAKAMDQSLNACDGHNALSYTLWVYEPFSTHAHGDGWNGEELSLLSYDEIPADSDDDLSMLDPEDLRTLVLAGSRGVESWCRPYPAESVGRVDKFRFTMTDGEFALTLRIPSVDNPELWAGAEPAGERPKEGYTKIFLPYVHYLHSSTGTSTSDSEPASSFTTVESGSNSNSNSNPTSTSKVTDLLPDALTPSSSRSSSGGTIVGLPCPSGEEWIKGRGPAVLGIEVELTEGTLRVEGQWGVWKYPLVSEDRMARLVIRPLRG